MVFKLSHYLMPLRSFSLMRHLEGLGEMRKRRERKSGFSRTVTSLGSGIPKTKELNCGIFLRQERNWRTFPCVSVEQLDGNGRVAIYRYGEVRSTIYVF